MLCVRGLRWLTSIHAVRRLKPYGTSRLIQSQPGQLPRHPFDPVALFRYQPKARSDRGRKASRKLKPTFGPAVIAVAVGHSTWSGAALRIKLGSRPTHQGSPLGPLARATDSRLNLCSSPNTSARTSDPLGNYLVSLGV